MAGYFAKPLLSGALGGGMWGAKPAAPAAGAWGKPPTAPDPMKMPQEQPMKSAVMPMGGDTLSTIGRTMAPSDAMPGIPQAPPLAQMAPASPEEAIMSGGQLDIRKLWALIQGRGLA